MRLSSKARYGLSALICLACDYDSPEPTTVVSLSTKLGISKIYLEQVFTQIKKAQLVTATKGFNGGYRLAHAPRAISVYDILAALETALIEKTKDTVVQAQGQQASHLEATLQQSVYAPLDEAVQRVLGDISLEDLAERFRSGETDEPMYYL